MLRLALLLLPATASAQVLLEEPFDTAPANGGWGSIAQPVAGVADLGAGRIRTGWRVNHPDAGTGVANRSPCFRKSFDGGSPAVTVRYWLRASSVSGQFGMYPVIIQSPANTLAEVRFTAATLTAFTPVLQCADAVGFRSCTPPLPPRLLTADDWSLVELQLEGLGTAQGRCRAAVNGIEFCGQSANWTGIQANSAFIGLCAVDQSWAGTMTIDELRVSSALQGSRLRINGPDAGNEGECLRFSIDTVDTFSQQPAPVAVPTSLDSVVFQGTTGFFASNCTSPSGPPELSPNAREWVVYARAGPSDISITASSADLLPSAPFSVRINRASGDAGSGVSDAGVTDAGVLDAGVPDAGVPDAGVPDAGVPDAGVPDAGVPDAGVLDAGVLDAGVPDAGVPDAGVPDSGVPDAGVPDAGVPDSGLSADAGLSPLDAGLDGGEATPDAGPGVVAADYDVGCGCTGSPWLQLIAWVALLLRRTRR